VVADAGDDTVDYASGVRVVDGTEAQLVHHCDRAGAHGDDVADDAAHAGGRALVGFDIAGVVVGLDLECHGPTVADVDDSGVLTDAHQQVLLHVLGDFVTELREVDLRGLVGAVFGPHDRIHRQLRRGGTAPEDLLDLLVLSALRPRSAKGCSTSGFAAANSTVSLTFFEVFCGESTCVESAELRFDDMSSSGPFHTTRHSGQS